jgi:hypothetical protein
MKPETEIHKTHDLIEMVLKDKRFNLRGEQREAMEIIGMALCWVLEHEKGDLVQQLHDSILLELKRLNITIHRRPGVGLEGN